MSHIDPRRIPRAFLGTIAILLASSFAASPGGAQYMYLDTNGDGLHSAADQVNPTGVTNIDIYLRTDQNRNGTPAVCSSDPGQRFTIISYVVNLRADGGTVTWGTFTNRQPTMTLSYGGTSTSEFQKVQAGASINPPGLYLLGTLSISTPVGSPSLAIVPAAMTIDYGRDPTSFGSQCDGLDLDNTLKLGSDWFDVDGLPFGTTTPVNHAPTLGPVADMTVSAGAVASQTIGATDPDADFLTIAKAGGPEYMAVEQTASTLGQASAVIRLAPLPSASGATTGAVSVSDGQLDATQSFAIVVSPVAPGAPVLTPIPDQSILAGTVARSLLQARDADGDGITFTKQSGPRFVTVETLHQGPATATGVLGLAPALCDVGSWEVTVAVQAGGDRTTGTFRVTVLGPSPAPSSQAVFFAASSPIQVHLCDLNEDGRSDVVICHGDLLNTISVMMAQSNGLLGAPVTYATPTEPWFLADGDLNGDGHRDIAVACISDGLYLLFGDGTGALTPGPTLPVLAKASAVAVGDLNGDGRPDLAVTNQSAAVLSVFLGTGAGAFSPRMDAAIGQAATGVALGDFNLDGRLDAVTANNFMGTISVLTGYGDGTFAPYHDITVGRGPYTIVAQDLDGDGILDLVAGQYGPEIDVLLGNGDATFRPAATMQVPTSAQRIVLRDFNGDGRADLAAAGQDMMLVSYFQGLGDGTFGPRRDVPDVPSSPYAVDAGDIDADGRPDLVTADYTQSRYGIRVYRNVGQIGPVPDASAFLRNDSRPAGAGKSPALVPVSLEPVAATYANADVDQASISITSLGTGSVDQVFSVPGKGAVTGDFDQDGIEEIQVYFRSSDLAKLLDKVQGRQTVQTRLDGALRGGRPFCSALALTSSGGTGPLAASIAPNPLNPEGMLSFRTSIDGFVKVRLYDLRGRLVRTLLESPRVPAGPQEVRIDGRTARGTPLASGLYFYRIETAEGVSTGRLAILK